MGRIRWGPIRTHVIFRDWDYVRAHNPQQTSLSPSIATEEFLSIRHIKRNAFSTSFLRPRSGATNSKKVSNACAQSILDLTSKHCTAIQHLEVRVRGKKGIRRAVSQRKQDWDDAVSCLTNDRNPVQGLVPTEDFAQDKILVLRRFLNQSDDNGVSFCKHLRNKVHRRPVQNVTVASIESNMWFDAEVLQRALDTRSTEFSVGMLNDFQEHKVLESHLVPEDVHPLCTQDGTRDAALDYTSESSPIHNPIMRLKTSERFHQRLRSKKEGSPWRRDPQWCAFCQSDSMQYLIRNRDLAILDISLEQQLTPFRQENSVSSEIAIHMEKALSHLEEYMVLESVHSIIEENTWLPERTFGAFRFSDPILTSGLSVWEGSLRNTTEGFCLERDVVISGQSSLDRLSDFVRHQSVLEQTLWSPTALDILRKSAYKRLRLLPTSPNATKYLFDGGTHLQMKTHDISHIRADNKGNLMFKVLTKQAQKHMETRGSDASIARASAIVLDLMAQEKKHIRSEQEKRIWKGLNTYDPPRRRRGTAYFEYIASRYESSQARISKSLHSEDPQFLSMEKQVSSSDESVLEDFIISDEEMGGDAGAGRALQEMMQLAHVITGEQPGRPERDQGQQSLREFKRRLGGRDFTTQQQSHDDQANDFMNVRVKVPETLICSSWAVKVAEYCLQEMRRGVLLVPPSLSLLPSIAVIAFSYLAESHCDHRVAVVCESETDMASAVYSYLDYSQGRELSIDVVRRNECPQSPQLATLAKVMGRIVILDSFSFDYNGGFVLLIILCDASSSSSFKSPSCADRLHALEEQSSHWSAVPSILIAPHPGRYDLTVFLQNAVRLSKSLKVKHALYADEKDDIWNYVALSRPDVLYLVPPQEVLEFVQVLDAAASYALAIYRRAMYEWNPVDQDGRFVSSLRDVKLGLLREFLNQQLSNDEQRRNLEVLYKLRNARSYALHDGFDMAIAYLKHCEELGGMPLAVREEVARLDTSRSNPISASHPMLPAIGRALRHGKESLNNQAPSLSSVHRRARFKPLLVAESRAAFESFLNHVLGATDAPKDDEGDVAVCERRNLVSASDQKDFVSLESLDLLSQFSHVIHVTDDRDRKNGLDLLPPQLMQYVHAGRTQLMSIVVDESRELEGIYMECNSLYSTLAQLAEEKVPLGQRRVSYLAQLPLSAICESDASCIPPLVGSVRGNSINSDTGSKLQELRFTSQRLSELAIRDLQSAIREKLSLLRRSSEERLHIYIHVDKGATCTPATTFLWVALTGDECLHRNTEVFIVFQ